MTRLLLTSGLLTLLLTVRAVGQEAAFDHAAYEARMREHIERSLTQVDPDLPDYAPTFKLTGRIATLGVDGMNNILTLVADRFLRHHPEVTFEIEGKGTSTAPPRLYTNTISFGTMTRRYNERERTPFVEKYGYEPTYFLVTWDVLAVWVHQDNPIESLTLAQLDAIFSNERRRGHPEDITIWGQLGLGGEWADRAITIHGRNPASETFGCFVRTALDGGQPKQTYTMHPGSTKTVEAVAADPAAIGFTGIGYRGEGVRAVPIVSEPGGPAVAPEFAAASEGRYPLARPFYLVLNHKPGQPLDPLRAEFLRFFYSRTGQAIVVMDGYSPLPADIARGQLRQVGLETPDHGEPTSIK